jgi:polar amino acid transport system substrate-binding protein
MTARLRATPVRFVAFGIALGLGAVACAQTDVPDDLPGPTTPTTPTTAAPTPQPAGCSDVEGDADWVGAKSLKPAEGGTARIAGLTQTIRERDLRVGVDTSTRLFSSVDPTTGEFVGFDVDIAREVAKALYGDEWESRLRFVAIPYDQRVQVLSGEGYPENEPQVDMVINTFTINCRRDEVIDFSSQYLASGQKLLVGVDRTDIEGIAGLTSKDKVCAPFGSTSIVNLSDPALQDEDPPEVVGAESHGECLVKLQRGQVDALSGDDTVLAGFKDQDPNLELVGDAFSEEPYGIGLPPGQDDWMRFVNAVLADIRADGTWLSLYDRHLADALDRGDDVAPPTAQYRDD